MEQQIIHQEKVIKKLCYETLYINEKKKREKCEIKLEQCNDENEKLKVLLKSKENEIEINKKKLLSYINSETAKNGYNEEKLVCIDLMNKEIKNNFYPMLRDDYDECSKIIGNYKYDIKSNNNKLKAQVKKYKKGQFQQLDRHWTNNLIKHIPELEGASIMLKDLYEVPLLSNGTHIDKTIQVKKLCSSNYSQEKLDNLLMLLNKNKQEILEYAFMGTNVKMQPEYLFGVEYIDNKRTKIILFKIKDIIDYLATLDFKISSKKTVIKLGNDSILTIQRKGGDGGKKCSNQLQFKIIVSKIIDKVNNLQHIL